MQAVASISMSGNRERVERAYDYALRLGFPGAGPWCELGNLLHNAERYTECEDAHKKALEQEPDDPFALCVYGHLLDTHLILLRRRHSITYCV
jgi:tetratricopeptide (TPR) repeat protein